MNLRATDHPEFDAWRWNDYWVPLDVVIEFKRGVYEMALTELSRFLPRGPAHGRYLRAGSRSGGARSRHAAPAEMGPTEPVGNVEPIEQIAAAGDVTAAATGRPDSRGE